MQLKAEESELRPVATSCQLADLGGESGRSGQLDKLRVGGRTGTRPAMVGPNRICNETAIEVGENEFTCSLRIMI